MDHSERLRLLGQFVGGIIHDLNNVLAALQSASILLRRRVHGEIATEILNHVDDAVSRGAQLTRQLLDFSRQDADVAKVLDLRELIMRDAELLRHLVGCDIAIGFEFADDVPPVLAPPSRVRSVLFNLIANSRDAIDHSGQYPERIVIRVSSRMLFARQGGLAAGSYAVVEIEDNGAGMTPEVLARLGQAFFTTKASGKGTGLGIPSAFELARMCGGDVELESEVGKGTLIRLVLGASPTREHTHAKLELCLDATLNGKATVLVIEHDELLREHVVGSLQGLGYTVLEAAGACAAVAQMMTAPHVDIVVCDLDRDDDGQEIATRLRDRFPELPIIFLSATGRGIPGGEIFLSKPVDEDMLARVILEQLGRLPARLLTNRLLKRSERLLPNPAGLDL
jgi:CheY-like chemotaxis protein